MSNKKNVKPTGKTAGNVAGNRNKVVVKSNNETKKKRSCCCSCLISILVAFVIFIGAGIGAGWYFGDKYAKQYLDMSIGDVMGVAGDVLKSKGSTIVTKSHKDTETELFENELKNAFFLKESANLNKGGIIDMFMPSGESGETGKVNSKGSYLSAALNAVPGSEGVDESAEQNPMVDYASSLLNAQNMDLDALESYDEANHDDYILNITDVQLAAFVSDVIKNYMDSSALSESLAETLPGVKPSELLGFEQMIFSGTQEDPHIKLTLSVNARKAASAFLAEKTGLKIGWVTYPVLPKLFYFTADIALKAAEGESDLKIYINNTDDAKMERLYKLIRNATKHTGNPIDPQALIDEKVGAILKPIASSLADCGDMSEIAEGKIKVDIFQLAIDLAGLNDSKTESERLTSSDLIYTLKYLLTSDFDKSIKTEHTWMDQYEKTGVVDKTYYKPADLTDEYTLIDYEQEMLEEIADKYLIDLERGTPDDKSDDRTFKDLMSLFGMGGESSGNENSDGEDLGDLMSWITPAKLGELAKKEGNIDVVITDRMLGAMFNAQIGSLMGGAGIISQLEPRAYQIIITEDDSLTRTFMEAGIEINLKSYASSGGSSVFSMLGGLLPESVMLSIKMEITPNAGDGYVYAPSELYYNDLTKDEVAHLLGTLSKLGVSMSEEELVGPMETSLRDVIKNMKKQMPGLVFKPSGVLMADLFTLTLDLEINKDKTNPLMYDDLSGAPGTQAEMTGGNLKELIAILYEGVDKNSLKPAALNQNAFLGDIVRKYFLDEGLVIVGKKPVPTEYDENQKPIYRNERGDRIYYVETFDDLQDIFSKDNFDAGLIDKPKLKHTATVSEDLRPFIKESELAKIIMGTMNNQTNADKFANMNIVSFEITEDEDTQNKIINIIAEAETNAMFGNNTEFKKFLSVEKLYLCISVNTDDTVGGGDPGSYYATTVTINNMSPQELAMLKALIGHYDPNNQGLNFEERARDIGTYIYDQFKTFSSSMGNNCEFVEGGVKIANIFELIAESQPYTDADPETPDVIPDSEAVRGALQGMSKNKNDKWDKLFSEYNYREFEADDEGIVDLDKKTLIFNPAADSYTLGNTIKDNELARSLTDNSNSVGSLALADQGNNTISLAQLNLYTTGRNIEDDFDLTGFEIDNYDAETKEYAVFTFKLTGWSADNSGTNNYKDLIEQEIYFTIVYERAIGKNNLFTVSTSNIESYMRVNNMTLAQQEILFNLARVERQRFDDQLDNCRNTLNNILKNYNFGYDSANNCGALILVELP